VQVPIPTENAVQELFWINIRVDWAVRGEQRVIGMLLDVNESDRIIQSYPQGQIALDSTGHGVSDTVCVFFAGCAYSPHEPSPLVQNKTKRSTTRSPTTMT
jgi:hypothetical protein